jgi:hypothetical protein
MKLKKKISVKEQRLEKLLIPGEILQTLESYASYYEVTYQEKIDRPSLMLEMLKAFLKSDRDFQKWMQSHKVDSAQTSEAVP